MNELNNISRTYCIQRLPDNRYVALNRLYKPIGVSSDRFVNYEESTDAIFALNITPPLAALISHDKNPDTKRVYLSDGNRQQGVVDSGYDWRFNVLSQLIDYKTAEALNKRQQELRQGADPTQEEIKSTLLHDPFLYALAMVVHDTPVGSPRVFNGTLQALHEAVLAKDEDLRAEGFEKLSGHDKPALEDFIDDIQCEVTLGLLEELKVIVCIEDGALDHGKLHGEAQVRVFVVNDKSRSAA